MIISVASGKGGTGKTTVAVNLALSLNNIQLLDCDVEEPNAAIFLNPKIHTNKKAFTPVPIIDKAKCKYCGKCQEVCEYNAIAVMKKAGSSEGNVLVLNNLCHGCGACQFFCPEKAIKEEYREIGDIDIGTVDGLQFVQGKLSINEAMAPPIIRQLKEYIDSSKNVIVDAPPGTSCSMVTAVQNTDYCVLVTEPTPFGLNDLKLAVETVRKLHVPFGVFINRFNIGDESIEEYCREEKIKILMRIPFDEEIAKAYSQGKTIVEIYPEYRNKFREFYNQIEKYIIDRKEHERSFNY